jgi:hypothetical protein
MVMIYIPSDVPLHKEQEYVWFRGRDFNGFFFFRYSDNSPFMGVGLTPRGLSMYCIYWLLHSVYVSEALTVK